MSKHRAEIPDGIAQLRTAFEALDRDPDDLPVRYTAIRPFTERSAAAARELRTEMDDLERLGVTELTLYVPGYASGPGDILGALAWLAGVVADELSGA